jgi:hypothetical protein
MELEVEGLAGAAYGEKSAERFVQRNGYRDRSRAIACLGLDGQEFADPFSEEWLQAPLKSTFL